jgi:hypothetical protein
MFKGYLLLTCLVTLPVLAESQSLFSKRLVDVSQLDCEQGRILFSEVRLEENIGYGRQIGQRASTTVAQIGKSYCQDLENYLRLSHGKTYYIQNGEKFERRLLIDSISYYSKNSGPYVVLGFNDSIDSERISNMKLMFNSKYNFDYDSSKDPGGL